MAHLKIKQPETYLQFYHALAEPCPYLPNKEERKFFAKISRQNGDEINALVTQAGFRRSHDIVYRPVCKNCQACISVRIHMPAWQKKTDSERRILRRNADITVQDTPATADQTAYELFLDYQRTRHTDSEMAQMTYLDYMAMTSDHFSTTRMLRFYLDETLIGVLIYDAIAKDSSAVYSFFNPELSKRSLGRFMIYALCDVTQQKGGENVYLGYWVKNSQKMDYKSQFSAVQYFKKGQWCGA